MYLGYVYNSHLEHSYIVLRVVQCFMSRLRKEKVQKSPMWCRAGGRSEEEPCPRSSLHRDGGRFLEDAQGVAQQGG